MKRKLLSWLLVFVTVFSLLPLGAAEAVDNTPHYTSYSGNLNAQIVSANPGVYYRYITYANGKYYNDYFPVVAIQNNGVGYMVCYAPDGTEIYHNTGTSSGFFWRDDDFTTKKSIAREDDGTYTLTLEAYAKGYRPITKQQWFRNDFNGSTQYYYQNPTGEFIPVKVKDSDDNMSKKEMVQAVMAMIQEDHSKMGEGYFDARTNLSGDTPQHISAKWIIPTGIYLGKSVYTNDSKLLPQNQLFANYSFVRTGGYEYGYYVNIFVPKENIQYSNVFNSTWYASSFSEYQQNTVYSYAATTLSNSSPEQAQNVMYYHTGNGTFNNNTNLNQKQAYIRNYVASKSWLMYGTEYDARFGSYIGLTNDNTTYNNRFVMIAPWNTDLSGDRDTANEFPAFFFKADQYGNLIDTDNAYQNLIREENTLNNNSSYPLHFGTPTRLVSATDDSPLPYTFNNYDWMVDESGSYSNLTLFTKIEGVDALDETTVLRDIISDNFTLPADFASNPSAYITVAQRGMRQTANNTPPAPLGATSPVTNAEIHVNGKTIEISGFNYADNYVNTLHGGMELLVTIRGLRPTTSGDNIPSNVDTSGVYKQNGELVKLFPVPTIDIPIGDVVEAPPESKSIVIDYNAPVTIASALTDDTVTVNGTEHNSKIETTFNGLNGSYTRSADQLNYRFSSEKLHPERDPDTGSTTSTDLYKINLLQFGGVDVAKVQDGGTWYEVSAVPANAVYFSDTLDNAMISEIGDSSTAVSAGSAQLDGTKGKSLDLTFTGTGIDIYSKTDAGSKVVVAQLYAGTSATGTRLEAKTVQNNLAAKEGTPSVWFSGLDYGTYTVRLYAPKGANFYLDGIRVYNPAGLDSTDENFVAANNLYIDSEKNATFTSLRDLMLESTGVDITGGVAYFTTGGDNAQTKTVTVNVIENGKVVGNKEVTYAPNTKGDYKVNGPKNEIYLDSGASIAFKIKDWSTDFNGVKLMVGMRVPEGGSASVVTNNTSYNRQVTNQVDTFFEVKPDDNGYVMIKNNGDALLSLTKLKVSGGSEAITPVILPLTAQNGEASNEVGAQALAVMDEAVETKKMFLFCDAETIAYTEDIEATLLVAEADAQIIPDDPEPTPSIPSIQEMIHAMISTFVANLFSSISRLFGGW